MEVDWGGKIEPNHTTSECMLYEVDWELMIQLSLLYLNHIDDDGEPKDFFTQGLWGGLPQRTSSTPLLEYLGFSTSSQSRNIEVHALFLILNTLEEGTIYLLNGTLGRNLDTFNQHHGRFQPLWKFQSKTCGC